jgi:hypothetical protein
VSNGDFQYPLAPPIAPIQVAPAAETLTSRTGDPYIGGSLPSEPRVQGMQPGFNVAPVPVMTITPELAAYLEGPLPTEAGGQVLPNR